MARLRRRSPWWGVGAIVICSFLLRAWLNRGMLAPFILVDELIYSELAKSLGDGGAPAIRGAQTLGYPPLYPLLVAPAYAVFDRVPDAYAAVKTINALAMSLAAVPAYLIARRVARPVLALLAAVLAVAIPAMSYTATIVSENLFYPVVLLFAWLLLRAIAAPTWKRSLLVLLALAIAVGTRAQAVGLVPVVVTAPLLLWALRGGRAGVLRPYVRLVAPVAGVAAVVLLVQLARGRSLGDLLGAYAVVGDRGYDVGDVLQLLLWQLEELTLAFAVAPVIVLLLLLVRARRLPPAVQAHLSVTVSMVLWMNVVVATFASQFVFPVRIQERYLFFLAPLLFAALVAWIELGAPRPPAAVALSASLPVLLVVDFPYRSFIGGADFGAVSDTFSLLPIWSSFDRLLFGSIVWTVGVAAAVIASVVVLAPRRLLLAVPVVVLLVLAGLSWRTWSAYPGVKQAGAGALFQGIRAVPRDWVDRAVPAGEEATVLWTGRVDRFTVNQNEIFNRRVGDVYYTDAPTPGGTSEQHVSLDPTTRELRLDDGTPLVVDYLLADSTVEPDGELVARDAGTGLGLWHVAGPVVLADTTVTGVYADRWSGPEVVWRRNACRPGTLTVSLSGDQQLFPGGQVVEALGRAVRVDPRGAVPAQLVVPLRPNANGVCTVRFTVSPVARPADVLPGSDDTRLLGTHFDAFVVHAR